VQGIEHGEKALAGHAEHALDAVMHERIDDETRAGGLTFGKNGLRGGDSGRHAKKSPVSVRTLVQASRTVSELP
jgi:hypothetical protein